MSVQQKLIELDHRIIVLKNEFNEISQSLHITDVDVNTLDERVSDIEEALSDIQYNIHERFKTVHWASSRDLSNLRKEVEEKLEMCKDAINNQHKTLREEKAELETRYTKAIYALRLIVGMNPHKFRGTEIHHLLVELGVVPQC